MEISSIIEGLVKGGKDLIGWLAPAATLSSGVLLALNPYLGLHLVTEYHEVLIVVLIVGFVFSCVLHGPKLVNKQSQKGHDKKHETKVANENRKMIADLPPKAKAILGQFAFGEMKNAGVWLYPSDQYVRHLAHLGIIRENSRSGTSMTGMEYHADPDIVDMLCEEPGLIMTAEVAKVVEAWNNRDPSNPFAPPGYF